MATLRERNRNRAMRELQELALDMFEDDGFDAVTVEDIAAAGGVSASTIYRYFGTKERLVAWEEDNKELTKDLVRRLASTPPIQAFRDALITTLRNEEANRPLLRRVRFLFANPQVHAAAIEQDLRDQAELADGFAQVADRRTPSLEDKTQAAVCMAALDAAVEEWQRAENNHSLTDLIARAFAAID